MEENFSSYKLEILSQQLENLAEYAESLWQFLPIAICNISPQSFILDTNPAFENLSQWQISEIAGKPLEIILQESSEIITETLKKGFLENYETELITKKGEKIDVAIFSHIRKDKEGNIIGLFLAFIDIRQTKKFQEELKRQVDKRTQELQEKIKELEEINRLTIGRELKMIELKKEIKKLKARLKKKS